MKISHHSNIISQLIFRLKINLQFFIIILKNLISKVISKVHLHINSYRNRVIHFEQLTQKLWEKKPIHYKCLSANKDQNKWKQSYQKLKKVLILISIVSKLISIIYLWKRCKLNQRSIYKLRQDGRLRCIGMKQLAGMMYCKREFWMKNCLIQLKIII